MSVAVRSSPLFATRRPRTVAFGAAVAAAAVGAALATTAEPTGQEAADAFWSAALVAVLATFGATARRWTWFVPAGVAAAIAGESVAITCAAVAIAIAFVSVLTDTRSRARGAVVTALGGIALLRADPIGFHGLTALLTAAAILTVIVSGYLHASRRVRRRARRVAFVVGGLIGLMLGGAALGVVSVKGDLTEGIRTVDSGMDAARDADDDLAAEELGHAARALRAVDGTLSSWFVSPAKSLPVVGPNLDAVSSLAAQASEVAEVSSLAADTTDVDALRFVGGRLDPEVVASMQPPLEQVTQALERLADEVDGARSPWLVSLVSSRIDVLGQQIDDALPDAESATLAVKLAPHLLGADGPQRYLVLFTTPVEARGRTGFPGNYAELYVEDGKLTMPVFGRISELERGGLGSERTLTQPADLVARYARFDVASTWRNLTMTPDFVSLAHAAAELYPQSGGQPINGVLSVDPAGLAALMRYTGPVEIDGRAEPLTSDDAEQYLLFEQYVLFEEANTRRVDVLEDVARTTFDRLTSADLPGPRALIEHLDQVVDGGHIQFVSLDPEALLRLHLTSVTGSLLPPDGNDSLTLTTANAGASKIDVFLRRREHYDVRWDPGTGQITGTLRVTLENTAPAEGLPEAVIGNTVGLPWGTNRSFVSVYSPFGVTASRIGGQPAALQAEVELGRNVYSTFVDIPAGSAVEIELDLAGTVEGSRYELDLPVQPFATPDEVAVEVEVVGGVAAAGDAAGGDVDVEVEGSVARFTSTLDQSRSLSVTVARE